MDSFLKETLISLSIYKKKWIYNMYIIYLFIKTNEKPIFTTIATENQSLYN